MGEGMGEWMDGWMAGLADGWLLCPVEGWMDGWMSGVMGGRSVEGRKAVGRWGTDGTSVHLRSAGYAVIVRGGFLLMLLQWTNG